MKKKQSCATCRYYVAHTDPYQPSKVFVYGTCDWLSYNGPEWLQAAFVSRLVFGVDSGHRCPCWKTKP